MPYKKRSVKRHVVVQPSDPSYRLIPLTQGQNAIVDTEDFVWLSQWDWFARFEPRGKKFYAQRKGLGPEYRMIHMHREILQCSTQEEPDHKNGDSLDNRRNNLRKATHAQNLLNKRKGVDNKSGFRGVYWKKDNRKWGSAIKFGNGKRLHLGYFDSPEDAARAYDSAARKYHGEFALLNFD